MLITLGHEYVCVREIGANDAWFGDADNITRNVCKGINGYLMQELVQASGHCDKNVANLFRQGQYLDRYI